MTLSKDPQTRRKQLAAIKAGDKVNYYYMWTKRNRTARVIDRNGKRLTLSNGGYVYTDEIDDIYKNDSK